MAGGDDTPKVPARERGTGDRGTDGRLTRDPPSAGADEAARAQAIIDLRDKYRADVEGQIKLGQRLQKEFLTAGEKHPLVRRAAASELLRVDKLLEGFESAAARGPGGILLQRVPFQQKPVPWPNRPRSLAEVAPFSAANVAIWQAVVGAAGPSVPVHTPPKLPTAPPRIVKKPVDESISLTLIKVPGMSLASPAGKAILMTKMLRVMSRQALSEPAAVALAPRLDIWKYLVLGFGETADYKIKTLERYEPGHEYGVKLKKEFLADAQKLTSVPLDAKQRFTRDLGNNFSSEYLPDNSADEHLWYALSHMKNGRHDPVSGYTPGQIVSRDGIMFVEPGFGDSTYFAPDGRLYKAKQASVHDQQLEAVRIGVVNASGGVVLGWTVVALGVGAAAAPAAISAASEALGSLLLGARAVAGAASAGGASLSALTNSILSSRFVFWLATNWHLVLAEGTFYYGLGNFAVNFDVRQFVAHFKRDPVGALKDLALDLLPIAIDAGEAITARPSPAPSAAEPGSDEPPPAPSAASRGAAPPADEPPIPAAPSPRAAPSPPPVDEPAPPPTAVPLPATKAPVPTPATGQAQPPTRNDVLKSMIANRQLKNGKPVNDDRMTNPATQEDLVAAPVVLKRDPTTGLPVEVDSTTGVTMSSRKPNNRSTGATTGTVTPVASSGRRVGPGISAGDGSIKGAGKGGGARGRGGGAGDGDGPDDDAAAQARATAGKTTAGNDNTATGGAASLTLVTRRQWTPVTPPPHPRFADRAAGIRQRLRFVALMDRILEREPNLPPQFRLGNRQRAQLNAWAEGVANGTIDENDVPRGQVGINQISIDSLEDRVNKGLAEQFRHRLAIITRMEISSVKFSNNVGDQVADFQAQEQGRPRAYSFTTRTAAGDPVDIDDFDFNTGQPIESKSISELVRLRKLDDQMTRQAIAVRDNGTQPIRWDVPPDVHRQLIVDVWGALPASLRQYVKVGPPTAPIRVTPNAPPPPPRKGKRQ